MKRLERILLSIIRRPVKSLILILLVFVCANVISGSIILYNSTQTIKNDIMRQILPVAVFKTLVDNPNDLSPEEWFELPKDEENRVLMDQTIKSFEEIKQLDEVNYGDYALSASFWTDQNIRLNTDYESSLNTIDSAYKHLMVYGVSEADSYYFKKGIIHITEGRNFTDEEIQSGAHVILMPSGSFFIDEKNQLTAIKPNDSIKLISRICSDRVLFDDYFNANGEEIKELDRLKVYEKHNQAVKDTILDENTVEFKVIGLYDDAHFLEKQKRGDYSREIGFSNYGGLVPLNFYLDCYQDRVEKIKQFDELGLIRDDSQKNLMRFLEYNVFMLNDSNDIPVFSEMIQEINEKYQTDMLVKLNNDVYLKIAGPLEGINSLSKFVLVVAVFVTMLILFSVSMIFIKERKTEIGILLSMGEKKGNVVSQILLEMILICFLAIGGSMLTSKSLSQKVEDSIMDHKNYRIELSKEEEMMVDESFSAVELMSNYEELLDTSNMFTVSVLSLILVLVPTCVSVLYVLGMKPKEILM